MNLKKIFYAQGVIYELGKWLILAILIIVLVNFFIVTVHIVQGPSMEPNFSTGEIILTNKLSYLISQPQRGDAVIIKFPGDPQKTKYIKRIIGLPGEKLEIKNGNIYINNSLLVESYIADNIKTWPDMTVDIPKDEYFIIGDNRPNSNDSRYWGTARKGDLIGKGVFILSPFSKWGFIPPVYYNI